MNRKFFNSLVAVAASGGALVALFHSHLLEARQKRRLPVPTATRITRSLQLPDFDLDMLNEAFCEFFRLALSTRPNLRVFIPLVLR